MPLKAILILLWFGGIPFSIGLMFTRGLKKNHDSFLLTMLCGYTGMFTLFEIMSLPMIFLRQPFTVLKYAYGIIMLAAAAAAFFINRKRIRELTLERAKKFIHIPWTCWAAVVFIAVQIVIYVLGMSLDLDDSFYVGAATTALETDTMFQYSAYTGQFVKSLPSRYVLSPFPIMLAFFGDVTGMSPTLIAHTVMPLFFVALTYGVFALLGQKLFKGDLKSTGMFLCFLSLIHMFSYYSVYTQGTFLLIRIWQGKALLAALILPFLFYTSLRVFEKDAPGQEFAILFSIMAASCLVSTMGVMLSPIMLGILTVLLGIRKRQWKKTAWAIGCCLPCIVCAVIYIAIR